MRLLDVARAFDNTPCTDAYTGDFAFNAQLGLYDDTKRDSETAERRILSVAPDVEIPARRVIELAGVKFIIGHGNVDTYRGAPLRVGYVVHEATHLSTVQTLSQLCKNLPGASAWAGKAWIKNMGYSEQDSALNAHHHIHLSVAETAAPGTVITMGAIKYLVRTTNDGAAGTLICYCDQMPEPIVEMADVVFGAYNPTTDTHGATAVNTRVVRVRWQSFFEYGSAMAAKFGPGDQQLVVTKVDVPVPVGARITLSDGKWNLASAESHGDVWICRGVKHA